MKKILTFLLLFIIAVPVLAFIFRDALLEAAITKGVTAVTGFKTEAGRVRFAFPSTVHIEGLKIHNPKSKGFNQDIFVSIPEIYGSLNLNALLKEKKIHLPEVRLNIAEVNIEKNKEGVSNVQMLSSLGGTPGATKPAPTTAEKQEAMPFQLDLFELTIRRVSYADQSGMLPSVPGAKMLPKEITGATSKVGGMVPDRLAVDLNVEKKQFRNITDPKALVNLIVVEVLRGTTFGNLMNLNPEAIMKDTFAGAVGLGKGVVTGSLGQGSKLIDAGAAKTGEALKGTLGDVSGEAASQVKGMFGKLKSTIAQNSISGTNQ